MIAFSVTVPEISAGVGVIRTAMGGGGGSVGNAVARRVGVRAGVSVGEEVSSDNSFVNSQASVRKIRVTKVKIRIRFIVGKL